MQWVGIPTHPWCLRFYFDVWKSKVLFFPCMIYAQFNWCQKPQESLTLDDAPSEPEPELEKKRVWSLLWGGEMGPECHPPPLPDTESRPRMGSKPPVAAARGLHSSPSDHHPLHPHSVGVTLDIGQAGDTENTPEWISTVFICACQVIGSSYVQSS